MSPEEQAPGGDARSNEPVGAGGDASSSGAASSGPGVEAAVRRLRIWLIVLTVLVALLVAAAVAAAIWLPGQLDEAEEPGVYPGMTVSDEQLATTQAEIENALGDMIADVEVRRVTMTFDDPSIPAEAAGEEQFVYVSFRLADSGVVVADILGGPYAPDVSSMGMLPTQGSLRSRMTEREFARFLAAYADETTVPLGSVRRYDDRAEMGMMPGTVQSDRIRAGGKSYKVEDLWAATEGLLVEGDTIGMEEMGTMRKAFIFYEDPKSGAFTFLGTESASGW